MMKRFLVLALVFSGVASAQTFTFDELTVEEKRLYAANLIEKGEMIREALRRAEDSVIDDARLESELTDSTELDDIRRSNLIRRREFTARTDAAGMEAVTPRMVRQESLDNAVLAATRKRDAKVAVLNELSLEGAQSEIDAATEDVGIEQGALDAAILEADAFRAR